MANAPTAEIAETSFAALVAAMQQLTLVLNANLTLMSNSSAMAAFNAAGLTLPAATPALTPQTPPSGKRILIPSKLR
ncbi:hypothetical protein M413DRAFT_25712 [Hebeloma cylindrosporum]|uniref:Uncharacterized protein n=1 Tax=Hebeloma cylindrosporum TaxID=76867 RepID=A0A0C3CJL0_HEBCY|nr:hypothetical protein M413DRAFT_25712 [Hebeloma cylindrosporum h7]